MKLFQIIRKNYKLLIRSKSSALVVLLGPLVLMLLISIAFNTSSLFDIRIGTYSQAYSDLSESLIQQLQTDEFKVAKTDSQESCMKGVETEQYHVCAIFPKDFSIKSQESIVFYVDKSKVNLIYIIINSISSKVAVKSGELSTALTTTLISALNDANTKIAEKKPLIGEVSTSLQSTAAKTDKVAADLQSLDLAPVGAANFTSIALEIEIIRNQTSSSSSAFSKLNSFISNVRTNLESTTYKLSNVVSIRDASVTELKNLQEGILKDKVNVQEIESSLTAISQSINAIEIKDVQKIVTPVTTEIKSVSKETTHLGYTFPTLLVMVIMFSCIFLAATSIVEERSSKAYFRNFISPTHSSLFVLGHYLFSLFVIFIQLFIIFFIMVYVTKTDINSLISRFIIILFLIASVFILLGMFLGYLFKSGETANIGAISIAVVLLFFSNTILPLETLPIGIRNIAELNPFVISENLLRKVTLFNESLGDMTGSLAFLVAYIIVFAVLTYIMREIAGRRSV